MAPYPSPVGTYHSSTYDTIDPTKSELSQQERNVAITGAGSGIGQAIAMSFAKANVANLALLGRRIEALQSTKDLIKSINPKTNVHLYSADIADLSSLERAFGSFTTSIDGPIHVLVANAGQHPGIGSLLEFPVETFSNTLLTNAIGTLNTLRAFIPHAPTAKDSNGYRARIVHTSTGAVQMDMPGNNAYAISKTAATKFVQAFAAENLDIWVVNFHPGMINTPMADSTGFKFDDPDDVDLAGDWTVWATSKGSTFLPSGRYLWAQWDVNEIEELFGKIKKGRITDGETAMGFPTGQRLTLGVSGLSAL